MIEQSRVPGEGRGGWVRLIWSPEEGVELVSGDSYGILGVQARRFIDSQDPLVLLPPEVSVVLSGGVPEVPVNINASGFSGSVSPSAGKADVLLFTNRELRDGRGIDLDDLGAGVIGTDRTGIIIQWNRAMSTIFRVPERHAIGRRLQDVLVQPILYSWDNVIQMVLDGRQVRVECRPEGQRRVESSFAPGGPGVIGTCFDTTESFQAERRLRTSRRMNQAYFHAVSTGLVLFDRDYRILVANRAFGRMFGLVENLLGIHLHEILPRESFIVLEDQTLPVFEAEDRTEGSPRVVRFVLPDGMQRTISQSVSAIMEDSGEVHYAVGIIEDNTREVMTEEELRNCRRRIGILGSLADVMLDGQQSDLNRVAERLKEALSSSAAAIYLFDTLVDNELSGSAGNWPESAPESFSDLRIPSFSLDTMQGSQLSGEEMGILGSWFGSCMVYPLEIEGKVRGYVVAAEADQSAKEETRSLAELASLLISLSISVDTSSSEVEQMNLLLERQSRMADKIISTLDVPAALFRADWSVLLWNRAMELLTGIPMDVALNRGEQAANLLFDAIGGISTAQRLIRGGLTEFPETWEVSSLDGEVTPCAWRLSGAESADRGSIEPVMILVGTEIGDIYTMQAAKEAADMYKALSHGTAGILASSTRVGVAETAATTFINASGASRIDLEMRGLDVISRSTGEASAALVKQNRWELVLETDTAQVGKCAFQGGRITQALEEFASNTARTYTAMERNAIGQRFADLADRASGRILICDSGGRILLSTWMDATEGAISGMNLAGVFEFPSESELNSLLQGILKTGRLDTVLTLKSGEEIRMTAVAINGHQGVPLLFLWPIMSEDYVLRILSGEQADSAEVQLIELLNGLSSSIAKGFVRIRDNLNPDHPISATLGTAGYAFETIRRALFYKRLLSRAWSHTPDRIASDNMLDAISSRFLEDRMQPPEVVVNGLLPEVWGNFELLVDLTLSVCHLLCPSHSPRISVSEVVETGIRDATGLQRRMDSYLCLDLHMVESTVLSEVAPAISESTIDIGDGLNPVAEMALLALAVRLAGGAIRTGQDQGDISILLPLAD